MSEKMNKDRKCDYRRKKNYTFQSAPNVCQCMENTAKAAQVYYDVVGLFCDKLTEKNEESNNTAAILLPLEKQKLLLLLVSVLVIFVQRFVSLSR